MTGSFREQDMKAEKALGQFMDEFFYSRLRSNNGETISFERYGDKEIQRYGIDICLKVGKKEFLIDEKASIYYSNMMIPTFAFELDSLQKDPVSPVEGWFINDELKTEYYMLIWPNVKCLESYLDRKKQWIRKEIKDLQKNDFTIVEAMLIKKYDLRSVLEKGGYDKAHLVEYAQKIRSIYLKSNSKEEKQLFDYVKITYSGQIAEKPVNLVIRKELLKEVAKAIYLISEDGYAEVKGKHYGI